MTETEIEKLISSRPKMEQARLRVLQNAVKKCLIAYNEEPSSANQRALRDAEQLLADTISDLADQAQAEPERFRSRKQALEWLRANGYKVSQGKFYQDCKAGYPAVASDGSVSRYQVLQYGLKVSKKTDPDMEALDAAEYNLRKAKADARIAELKAARLEREHDRLWLHADDAWAMVAGLVGNLRDAIRHHLYSGRRDLVETVKGDQDRADEVYELLDTMIDRAYNDAAAMAVDIKFEKKMEDEG